MKEHEILSDNISLFKDYNFIAQENPEKLK